MTRTALLVVDMLTDFFIAKPGLPVPVRMAPLLANTQKVCRKAREKGIPVVFANDSFQKTEIPIDRHFKLSSPHAIIGTEEALIVKDLEYDENKDFIVTKKMYDGFYNTRMDSILRELDIKTCVVTGTWTNACVQHTAMGAWCRGYDVIVLKDCCSCPDEKEHDHALAYMKQFYGTEAMDSTTWIALLDGKPPTAARAGPRPAHATLDDVSTA